MSGNKREDSFPFRRGSNMGMWLSQVDVTDEKKLGRYGRDDIARLAQVGADHIRLPVDYELIENPNPPHELLPGGMAWVDRAVEFAWAEGLGVILDLHKCAGMSFYTPESNNLWGSAQLQDRFAGLWARIATHFRGAPYDRLALEILNEPTCADNLLWNSVAGKALASIRKIDPARWVVIGSNSWNVPSTFVDLEDFKDPRVAYAVHWYEPFIFTHQKAPWCEWLKKIDLTVHYPSRLADLSKYKEMLADPAWCEQLMLFSDEELCYERMERCFKPIADFAERSGAPIICTEFGCWDPAPPESQLAWFSDCIRLFDKHDVAWSQWEYSCLYGKDGRAKPPVGILFGKG